MPVQTNQPGGRTAVVSYVATLSADLTTMVRDTDFDTHGYLLEMVRLKATEGSVKLKLAKSSARQSHGTNGRRS